MYANGSKLSKVKTLTNNCFPVLFRKGLVYYRDFMLSKIRQLVNVDLHLTILHIHIFLHIYIMIKCHVCICLLKIYIR